MRRSLLLGLGLALGGAIVLFGLGDGSSGSPARYPERARAADGGARVTGTIVDGGGLPVAFAVVELVPDDRPDDADERGLSASSGDGGSFAFDERMAPGTWSVRLDAPHRLRSPATLVVPAGREQVHIGIITADPVFTISGHLVDDRGAGIPHQPISARWPTGSGGTTSAHDGRFVLQSRGSVDPDQPVRLSVSSNAHHPPDPLPPFAWGAEGVEIRLRRRLTAALDVAVDDASVDLGVRRIEVHEKAAWMLRSYLE